jgi:hypothetical protein
MSYNASRITRTVAGVLIAAGIAMWAAVPAHAAHVDHGHALLPQHVTRQHPVAHRDGRAGRSAVSAGQHHDLPWAPHARWTGVAAGGVIRPNGGRQREPARRLVREGQGDRAAMVSHRHCFCARTASSSFYDDA